MTLITPDIGIIFWQTITFLVVLFLLSRFAWKPILAVLKEREHAVAHAINQIAEAQTLMKQVTYDRAKLLGEANLECKRMIDITLETQQKIIEQEYQKALAIKEELLTQAKLEISREECRVVETLKNNMGLLAIQVAEKLLIQELSQNQSQLELIERVTASNIPSA